MAFISVDLGAQLTGPTLASLGSMLNLQPSDFLGGGAAGATGAATGGIVPVTQTQVQGGVALDDQSSNTVQSVLRPSGS